MGGVLFKKLLRDFWAHRMSIGVLIFIVTTGVGSLITFNGVYRDMVETRDAYCRDYRLADFIMDIKRAPESVVEEVRTSPNVAEARGRVSIPALLEIPNQPDPINGIVISLPEIRRPVLNDILLCSGAYFSGGEAPEAIINDRFARANGLKPGSHIKALLLDEQHDVLVVGTAVSPEFVATVPPDGGIVPDPSRFGVLYMPEEFLQHSADLDGAYNQIIGKTFDRSPPAIDRTMRLIEGRLEAWGVINASAMIDQPSVRFLIDELRGLFVSSKVTPTIFLLTAMLILNVLMSRMVAHQRTIIGTLKALGRSTASIVMHYVGYGLLIAFFGCVGGIGFAMFMQPLMVKLYSTIYTLPNLRAHLYPDITGLAFTICIVAALLGVIHGAHQAAKLQPAEAMRPPAPERGGKIILERFTRFWNSLSFRWRLACRSMFRNPFRSMVSLGSSFVSMTLILNTLCIKDSLNYLMDYQFNQLAHQDLMVNMREPIGVQGPQGIAGIKGVTKIEPQLNVYSELSNGAYLKRIAVTGMSRDNELFTPLDSNGHPIKVPSEGLMLSNKVAEILHVKVGDTVSLRPLIGRRERAEAPVVAVVATYLGLSAYAEIHYLSRLIGEDWVANSILADTMGADAERSVNNEVKEMRAVIAVSRRTRGLEQMKGTFGKTQGTAFNILIMFAGLIAFGSTLNNAFVSLSEREREVGVFRVMGYTAGEVAAVLRGELVVLSILGTLAGIVGGISMTALVASAYNTDIFRFPVVVHPFRIFHAIVIMAVFISASQIIMRVMVGMLDWLEAIKSKE